MNAPWKPDDMANRPGGLTIDKTLKKVLRSKRMNEPVAFIKDRELGYMLAIREVGATEWNTSLGLYPEAGDVPLYTAPPPAFQEIEELNELYMAAKNVIDWTERAYEYLRQTIKESEKREWLSLTQDEFFEVYISPATIVEQMSMIEAKLKEKNA